MGESAEAVKRLRALGLRTIMLTGDNEGSARAVQKVVGVSDVRARLLPQDKVNHLKLLRSDRELVERAGCCSGSCKQKYAVVGMVGDGVNDAPALALATVGIAMGATGTVVAMETADVALMDTDLRKVAKAVRLGRMASRTILQNVVFAIVTKLAVFVAAFCGYAHLWLAIATDVGAMIVVTLNGVSMLGRPKRKTLGHAAATKCKKANTNANAVASASEIAAKKQANPNLCSKGCCGGSGGDAAAAAASASEIATKKQAALSACNKGCCGVTSGDAVVLAADIAVCSVVEPVEHYVVEVTEVEDACDVNLVVNALKLVKGVVSAQRDAATKHFVVTAGSKGLDKLLIDSVEAMGFDAVKVPLVFTNVVADGVKEACYISPVVKALKSIPNVISVEFDMGTKCFSVGSTGDVADVAAIKTVVENMGFAAAVKTGV